MKKKILAVIMVCTLALSVAACGTIPETTSSSSAAPASSAPASSAAAESAVAMIDDNTYATGDRIVKDPITLKVTVVSGSHVGPMAELEWIKRLQEDTGIKLEFNHINSGDTVEQRNLIFATQDYPDIFWGNPTDQQIFDCIQGDSIYPLNDLIDKYAPNWKTHLEENDNTRKLITSTDGQIYSLPCARYESVQNDIRDQWLINKVWLDELGLKVPTTDVEFLEAMRAFKANAGKGSIPEGVLPYYFRYQYYIGSQLDFYAAYGVVVPGDQDKNFLSISKDGKVEYNFTDKAIMKPVNMLSTLYKEELIPGAVFTDEWNDYLAKTRATPAFVGSFHSFHNPDAKTYVAMPPFKVEGVSESYIRSQLNQITRNYFTIFKNNKYAEASIRLADVIADPERSLTGFYGSFGEYLQKDGDKILQLPQEADSQMKTNCPGNALSLLITLDSTKNLVYDGALKTRAEAVAMYKPFVLPTSRLYPRLLVPQDIQTRYTELETDINNLTKSTFADWIAKGGIEGGWDAYIAQLDKAGLKEYLELAQKSYDGFNKN